MPPQASAQALVGVTRPSCKVRGAETELLSLQTRRPLVELQLRSTTRGVEGRSHEEGRGRGRREAEEEREEGEEGRMIQKRVERKEKRKKRDMMVQEQQKPAW